MGIREPSAPWPFQRTRLQGRTIAHRGVAQLGTHCMLDVNSDVPVCDQNHRDYVVPTLMVVGMGCPTILGRFQGVVTSVVQ